MRHKAKNACDALQANTGAGSRVRHMRHIIFWQPLLNGLYIPLLPYFPSIQRDLYFFSSLLLLFPLRINLDMTHMTHRAEPALARVSARHMHRNRYDAI